MFLGKLLDLHHGHLCSLCKLCNVVGAAARARGDRGAVNENRVIADRQLLLHLGVHQLLAPCDVRLDAVDLVVQPLHLVLLFGDKIFEARGRLCRRRDVVVPLLPAFDLVDERGHQRVRADQGDEHDVKGDRREPDDGLENGALHGLGRQFGELAARHLRGHEPERVGVRPPLEQRQDAARERRDQEREQRDVNHDVPEEGARGPGGLVHEAEHKDHVHGEAHGAG
mmetsp:Transcript_12756/g.37994  ORF Transcript_12756/g.37994 Transcript_12756/m.37994 type:complete len:226 (-) Transcript_12756:481-1158(-)